MLRECGRGCVKHIERTEEKQEQPSTTTEHRSKKKKKKKQEIPPEMNCRCERIEAGVWRPPKSFSHHVCYTPGCSTQPSPPFCLHASVAVSASYLLPPPTLQPMAGDQFQTTASLMEPAVLYKSFSFYDLKCAFYPI